MPFSGRGSGDAEQNKQEELDSVQQFSRLIIPSRGREARWRSSALQYETEYTRSRLGLRHSLPPNAEYYESLPRRVFPTEPDEEEARSNTSELALDPGSNLSRGSVDPQHNSDASANVPLPSGSQSGSHLGSRPGSESARIQPTSENFTVDLPSQGSPALDFESETATLIGSDSSESEFSRMDDLRLHTAEDERVENFPGADDDEDMMGSDEDGVAYGQSDEELHEEDDLAHEDEPVAPFNPISMGLKEIGGLAHFRVSSFKPGNGVEELVSDDTDRYWQSDGIQPHRLTMTFVKCVEIRALRFHVDYHQDESYTPTRIMWYAGTSEHSLMHFATSNLVNPEGWTDVPLAGAGGGEDGNSLLAWVVQMQIIENHQNGKDTHIRGVKIYGFDDQLRAAGPTGVRDENAALRKEFKMNEDATPEENEEAFKAHVRGIELAREFQGGDPSGTASSLDFMEDPQLR